MKKTWLWTWLIGMVLIVGCSTPGKPLVDPHLSWSAPAANCDGTPITGTLSYNVYAVQGPGPIPTTPTPNEVPCGVLQLASGVPLNTAPIIAGTTFQADVISGVWTFAVEAVDASGGRSELSAPVTVTVMGHPSKPTSLQVTLNKNGKVGILIL